MLDAREDDEGRALFAISAFFHLCADGMRDAVSSVSCPTGAIGVALEAFEWDMGVRVEVVGGRRRRGRVQRAPDLYVSASLASIRYEWLEHAHRAEIPTVVAVQFPEMVDRQYIAAPRIATTLACWLERILECLENRHKAWLGQARGCRSCPHRRTAASIHLARWVALVRGSQYRVVVFPVMRGAPCGKLSAPYRLVRNRDDVSALPKGEVGVFDFDSVPRNVAETVDSVNAYSWPGHPAFPDDFRPTTAYKLTKCIRDLDPDLVHSMEVQFAGYLTLEAKRRIGRANFPPWLLSNWGNDVLPLPELCGHLPILQQVFREIDGYWSECGRDVKIARDFDYRGKVFEPIGIGRHAHEGAGGLGADAATYARQGLPWLGRPRSAYPVGRLPGRSRNCVTCAFA